MLTINRRLARAKTVASFVMNSIEPFLERLDRLEQAHAADLGQIKPSNPRRAVYRAIMDTLMAIGIEVITEADRLMVGLEPRNPDGLTDQELRAIDARLTVSMLSAPLPQVIPIQHG